MHGSLSQQWSDPALARTGCETSPDLMTRGGEAKRTLFQSGKKSPRPLPRRKWLGWLIPDSLPGVIRVISWILLGILSFSSAPLQDYDLGTYPGESTSGGYIGSGTKSSRGGDCGSSGPGYVVRRWWNLRAGMLSGDGGPLGRYVVRRCGNLNKAAIMTLKTFSDNVKDCRHHKMQLSLPKAHDTKLGT
ncbi:hypothetical protein Tco_0837050 [Tanacetum coccineum]